MNATVSRIVEIMFQDTVMSEEVSAIKDEVMNNCQERYEDLVASGMSEDDAIATVVDSLKGMEEVIAQYPKIERDEDDEDDTAEENGTQVSLTFTADQVQDISISLSYEDVTFEASDDEYLHVIYDEEQLPQLKAACAGGSLRISREDGKGKRRKEKRSYSVEFHGSLGEGLGKMLANILQFSMHGSDTVLIQLPEAWRGPVDCTTTNGEVEVQSVYPTMLHLRSTSGDVTVETDSGKRVADLNVTTTSGDIEVNARAGHCVLRAMSGDIDFEGECQDLTVESVSGDVDLSGGFQRMFVKTVSGDMEVEETGTLLKAVTAQTVSGDLRIDLPEAVGSVSVRCKSSSGDVHCRYPDAGDMADVVIRAQSISGDVYVR